MSRFEKFAAERDVIERIEALRDDGFRDDEITVISRQKLEYAYMKFRDVNFRDSEGTTWDKFISMFSDGGPEDKVLGDLDISETEKEHFKEALDRGEILLLKDEYGVREEGYVRNETRDFHETQRQDAQGLESEAMRDERLEIQKEMRRRYDDASYDYPDASRAAGKEEKTAVYRKVDDGEYGYSSKPYKQKDRRYGNLDESEYGYKKVPGSEYGYKKK
ncbi:general stress protein [Salinicoccus halitifaciens]|uniref:General stress protein 17M-like domain-containing protein n=1 Tax=Salinicoccus halitifaciens TaxID=1073415 RepID=A0ABV2E8Q4_9STAP|nr:general stress protein [Salinicoccus halitifaciens]MCD2137921.1 general stress protein [Salinicoccus halitifaciens]